jgi:sugar lactone lactonase YvrE
VYVADSNNHRIRRITRSGIVSTFAGTGAVGSLNAAMLTSTFNTPRGVAVDSAGNVYVADSGNRLIRRITLAGVVTTFAGSATSGFADGTGTSATFNTPVGITVDRIDTVYVSDIGNHRIRRITSAGVVTTFAGTTQGFQDGVGTNARFDTPQGIVADTYGNVYVADTNNHRIRRVTSDGTVTTLAGSTAGYADGIGTNARFNFPYHLSIDVLGTLYVADQTNHRIRTIQTSTGVVSTLAGDGTAGFTPSRFNTPQGITLDRFQNAYVADSGNHSIRRIPNTFTLPQNNGVATILSSSGFYYPDGIAVDLMGNVYSTNYQANQIYKYTSTGVDTLFAGNTFQNQGNVDGTGTNARFSFPKAVAVDLDGNIYVADYWNQLIRRISPGGEVTRYAGSFNSVSGPQKGSTDGFGGSFNDPLGVAVDSAGNVYVADYTNSLIRKISPMRVVSTLAGNRSASAATVNGTGTNARFYYPHTVAVDSAGVVYVLEEGVHLIRRISLAGVVTTLAGQATAGYLDGTGTNAQFDNPRGIAVNSAGTNVYVSDTNNGRLRRIITSTGVVSTVAAASGALAVNLEETVYVGSGGILKIGTIIAQLPLNRGVTTTFAGSTVGFLNGTGTSARFNGPWGVAVNSVGTIFVADRDNSRIRSITPLGVVSTFAGTGSFGSTDGAATSASFNAPRALDIDLAGNLYVVDFDNQRIRKITSAGVVSTFAGSVQGFQDGSGTSARFNNPNGIATDLAGNVYVTDGSNNVIRKITSAGVVTTFAGKFGFSGSDDGVGTNATFTQPRGVGVDSVGNLYVGDSGNHRIRKITPLGVVSTFAGSGIQGLTDGTGTNASFSVPSAIRLDSTGNIYVLQNLAIRKITSAGVVTTIAGREVTGGPIDGTGTNALFVSPGGIAIDSSGTIYIGDTGSHRIRKIQ